MTINLAGSERPMRYDKAIGQEANARILKSMSKKEAFSKAYVFEGLRGCGKTSLARVTAMAANCLHKGPDGEPCGECEVCRKIKAGEEVDVVEIDAASNNSVERARELIEESRFKPLECRTKVYIIDEAHMLSNGAFNALLKLLEEPPAWCMYILCTTAKNKLPGTILSRCTAFTFKAISFEKIAEHLKEIAKKYGANITDDAAYLIASHSGGSMRDALRDLEKCLSEAVDLGTDEVIEALGLEPYEQVFGLLGDVVANNPSAIISACERYRTEGRELPLILSDVVSALTDLVMVTAGGNLTQRGEGYMSLLGSLAKKVSLEKALYLSKRFAEVKKSAAYDADPAVITVEILRIASANEQSVEALEVKIRDLEELIEKLEKGIVTEKAGVTKTLPVTEEKTSESVDNSVYIMQPESLLDEDDEAYWSQVMAVAESFSDEEEPEVVQTSPEKPVEDAAPAVREEVSEPVTETKITLVKEEVPASVTEPVISGEPEKAPDSVSILQDFSGEGLGGLFDLFGSFKPAQTSEEANKGLARTFQERLQKVKEEDPEARSMIDRALEVNVYKDCVEVTVNPFLETVAKQVLSRYEFIKVSV